MKVGPSSQFTPKKSTEYVSSTLQCPSFRLLQMMSLGFGAATTSIYLNQHPLTILCI